MDKIIKVGLAGFGRSGYNIHRAYLVTDSRFKIVAVADALPERRKQAETELGAVTFDHYEKMIDHGGFDLLVNATPSKFHVPCSLYGLEHGLPVLSEKPTAITVEQFDQLIATAQQHNVLYFPFQNARFYPYFTKIQEVVQSGVLGRLVSVRINWSSFGRRWDWQTRQDQFGGGLFNTGPHPMDHAIVLFGDEMPQVFCRMDAYHYQMGGDADNFCAVTLYGTGHPTIEVQVSSFAGYAQGAMYNIQGIYGSLEAGMTEVKWKYFNPATAPVHQLWRPWSMERQGCSEQLNWIEKSWHLDGENDFSQLSKGIYDNLYEVLCGGGKRIVTLDQVRRQVAAIAEAHRQNSLPVIPLD